MALRLTPSGDSGQAAEAMAAAQAAHDLAENARQMVLKRDPRLMSLEDVAQKFAVEIARTDQIHADLQSGVDAALARTMTPGPAGERGPAGADGAPGAQGLRGPSGVDGVQGAAGKDGAPGAKGDAGPAGSSGADGARGPVGPSGTANLAVGARPVVALALGASATVTVPLSRTMPDTNYRVELAHSAVVSLAAGMLSEVSRTTSSVTVKVTAVGVAIAGGTLIAVAC